MVYHISITLQRNILKVRLLGSLHLIGWKFIYYNVISFHRIYYCWSVQYHCNQHENWIPWFYLYFIRSIIKIKSNYITTDFEVSCSDASEFIKHNRLAFSVIIHDKSYSLEASKDTLTSRTRNFVHVNLSHVYYNYRAYFSTLLTYYYYAKCNYTYNNFL